MLREELSEKIVIRTARRDLTEGKIEKERNRTNKREKREEDLFLKSWQ